MSICNIFNVLDFLDGLDDNQIQNMACLFKSLGQNDDYEFLNEYLRRRGGTKCGKI